ncbi:MAG TPA: tetratricopeptide repeat protein, partial [Candidatus Eisenbacteria bacterium]|nr:tetratricopeptide repeat protein [Candidatus Eisenbacteria bacterium]
MKEQRSCIRFATVFTLLSLLCVGVGWAGGTKESTVYPETSVEESAGDERGPIETIQDLPRDIRMALFKAQERRANGEILGAVKIIKEFLEKHPYSEHYLLHFHLANNLVELQEMEEAIMHYERAVELEDRYAQGWLNLGEAAYNTATYSIAAKAIETGYRLDPKRSIDLLYYASVARLLNGEPQKAIELLRELMSAPGVEHRLDWYRGLLSAYSDLKDYENGAEAAGRMIEKFGMDPEAWKLAFQFAAGSGDFKRAAVALTVVGYMRPLTREEELHLGDLYSVLGVPYKASYHYEAAIESESSPREFEKLASAYLASYDVESALETLRRALDRNPTPKLWSLLGDLYYMERDYGKSLDAFQSCAMMDPEHGRAYLMMGYCALEMRQPKIALEQLTRAAEFEDQREMALALL